MKTKSTRLQYIDIAKGIAMICIILGHLGNASINRIVFTFHVPIFFFITGYFTNKKRDLNGFIKNKARTLLVPYIISSIVIIIIGTLKGVWWNNAFDEFQNWCYAALYGAGDTYTEQFWIPGIGAIWFLWATFWGSIFLRISFKFDKYIRLLFIVGLFAVGYFSRRIFWFPFSIQAGACATMFIYMGYLWRGAKTKISELPKEVKIFSVLFALLTWISFIKNFQSFWLVHCDIGRGIIDIFGCICACVIVILISKIIECRTKYIGGSLAYLGRYSLLILCVHIVELDLLPWWQITEKYVVNGMSANIQLILIIAGKVLLDLGGAFVLSKITLVRKIFGFKN